MPPCFECDSCKVVLPGHQQALQSQAEATAWAVEAALTWDLAQVGGGVGFLLTSLGLNSLKSRGGISARATKEGWSRDGEVKRWSWRS